MSNQLSSKSKSHDTNHWDKIIRLGDIFVAQQSIDILHQRIIAVAQEIFAGQAVLRLAEHKLTSPHIRPSRSSTSSEQAKISYQTSNDTIPHSVTIKKIGTASSGLPGQYSMTSPIIVDNTPLGTLTVERIGQRFTKNEQQLMEGLTHQIAISLNIFHQHMIDKWSVELLDLVRSIGQQINNIYDFDDLIKRIALQILDRFQYYYVGIYTIDPVLKILQFRFGTRRQNEQANPNDETIKFVLNTDIGEGIIGRVALTGKEILENNVESNSYYRHSDGLPETRSEFALPLIVGGETIGVLDIQSDKQEYFSELDALVLRALADLIAMAINNAQLYTDLEHRASRLAMIADISKAISSILDFDHLLNNIVTLIHIRFSVPRVNLFTVHTGREKIIYRAGAGELPATEVLVPNEFSFQMNSDIGLVSWAVQNQQSIIISDTRTEPRFCVSPASPDLIRSELVIPLKYGSQILGVLDLQSQMIEAFNNDDLHFFETLADYISVAFRNANLYSTEQWRRQVSDSMRDVGSLLSADVDLHQVLKRVLLELLKSLPCEVAAIWLLEDFGSEDGMGQFTSPLHLAAIVPETEYLQELTDAYDLPAAISPWMVEALDSQYPLIRSQTSPYEPLGSYLNYPPEYSAIASPLRAGDQTLGLLVLAHRSSGRYGSEAQAMTSTFANYSAVAIKNTRLYEAAHDQAWVATVLLQVTEAIQSISSMNELLETVTRIIPRIIGLKSCVLFIRDEKTELFLPMSESGLDANQRNEYESWQIELGDVPAFDLILELKAPIFLDESNFPAEIVAELFSALDINQELFGLFPMVSQNHVLGAMLINFSLTDKYGTPLSSTFEEKFSILQGVANQTAVAVENIQLLQSQEEEAYISIALLQVAQAIVSLSNLDEILHTIVRIMPILVGVKRCVIFLCDDNRQGFQLSQSYGVSKQELSDLPSYYRFSEHNFLRSIRSFDNIGYWELSDDDAGPSMWSSYIPYNAHIAKATLTESGEDEVIVNEYHKYKGRLLIGIPLSIKGNVLGIMIIEEGEIPRGHPSYHIRERRLEIISGIAQQASLAIHNDLLQHEVVNRERLEREMQLAREIQTTFLPEAVPSIPGWDLDVRWQPARQVGGDFYDFLLFPDGQIGIVIADVADKGMPAALFMTLVRTLIRAAAKDNSSPARIMMQVNDLLVPDAKQGMFVTVVIASFSPESGNVVYANAGHNPPLLHRSSENILTELQPTGMALGVDIGVNIKEERINIMPGDRIVFYTDGITEAFSSTNEIFGVERLREIILRLQNQDANVLLTSIEKVLNEFAGGADQSDDITLAALIRRI